MPLPLSPPWSTRINALLRYAQASLPGRAVLRFIDLDLMSHAAALAFYALLSLAPLLLLLLWLTASLLPSAQDALLTQIRELAGHEAEAISRTVLANAKEQPSVGSLAGLWSTLLLFVGATVVFGRLQATLNLIFRSDAENLGGMLRWLRKRVFSFGVVFALGFLLLLSVTLTTVLQLVFAHIPSLLPIAGHIAAALLYTLGFTLLYKYLPDRAVRWPLALRGGFLTALLFMAGRWLIGLYVLHAAPGSAYGSMGALVLLLVWMYYAALVFFIGALLTALLDEPAPAC